MIANNSFSKLKADIATWPFGIPWSFQTIDEKQDHVTAQSLNDPGCQGDNEEGRI